jgi:hypothetical protein
MGRGFGGKGWFYSHSYVVQGLFSNSKHKKNCGLQEIMGVTLQ